MDADARRREISRWSRWRDIAAIELHTETEKQRLELQDIITAECDRFRDESRG